jgi:hypothetical protein
MMTNRIEIMMISYTNDSNSSVINDNNDDSFSFICSSSSNSIYDCSDVGSVIANGNSDRFILSLLINVNISNSN